VPILESPAKRKVLRCGRRFGKSRFAMVAAIDGHGPRDPKTGRRRFPGILQGKDIVWVAQDYPNLSTVMWREEFVPRFKHLPFVSMNANEHYIQVHGLGTLYLRPETAIGGIRGIGKNLGGVIADEAAWYDLEAALKDVILAALLDNDGWLILMSTTNAGLDGNLEKRTPSYFNIICEEIRSKQRSAEWEEFYGTAYDNPRLSKVRHRRARGRIRLGVAGAQAGSVRRAAARWRWSRAPEYQRCDAHGRSVPGAFRLAALGLLRLGILPPVLLRRVRG
jgi:hypothetical protein